MKYYFCYITLPDEVKAKILLFQKEYTHLEYQRENDVWFGIFGFTKEKSVIEKFKEIYDTRYFTFKTVEIDKSDHEYEKLRSYLYMKLELSMREVQDQEDSYNFPMNDVIESCINDKDFIFDYLYAAKWGNRQELTLDFFIFPKEIQFALDLFCYTQMVIEYQFGNVSLYTTEDPGEAEARMDQYMELMTYGKGLSGFDLGATELNTINTMVYVLGDLITT